MDDLDLRIEYGTHDGVRDLIEQLVYVLEGISLAFDRWDERHVSGPGLYLAVVTGPSVADFADPMGHNRWPTDRCRAVEPELDTFFETAREVAMARDGGVVVSVDGVVQKQMVRFRDLAPGDLEDAAEPAEYEDWMGARHMSALDTSRRPNVVATVTLSEETGRVTIFQHGSFETFERAALGGEWNVAGYD